MNLITDTSDIEAIKITYNGVSDKYFVNGRQVFITSSRKWYDDNWLSCELNIRLKKLFRYYQFNEVEFEIQGNIYSKINIYSFTRLQSIYSVILNKYEFDDGFPEWNDLLHS